MVPDATKRPGPLVSEPRHGPWMLSMSGSARGLVVPRSASSTSSRRTLGPIHLALAAQVQVISVIDEQSCRVRNPALRRRELALGVRGLVGLRPLADAARKCTRERPLDLGARQHLVQRTDQRLGDLLLRDRRRVGAGSRSSRRARSERCSRSSRSERRPSPSPSARSAPPSAQGLIGSAFIGADEGTLATRERGDRPALIARAASPTPASPMAPVMSTLGT
jgi:hypothetical protein